MTDDRREGAVNCGCGFRCAHDVAERLDREPAESPRAREGAEEVIEMFLCESAFLFLRPNHLYRFKVDQACQKCLNIEEKGRLRG
jgi:hypothetical protein